MSSSKPTDMVLKSDYYPLTLHDLIDSILVENREFSVGDYIKKICCGKDKRILIYSIGLDNLTANLDINNYLKNHLELNLVKEVLFDKDQLLTFDIISSLLWFRKMFEKKVVKNDNLTNYEKSNFQRFYDSVSVIMKRENIIDEKIINFIRSKLLDN